MRKTKNNLTIFQPVKGFGRFKLSAAERGGGEAKDPVATLGRLAQKVALARRAATQARTGRAKGLRLGALMTSGQTALAVARAETESPAMVARSFRMLDAKATMESPVAKATMARQAKKGETVPA